MKRREFFKKAGLGSAALVSLPTIAHTLAKPARADQDDDDNRMGFDFVCSSQAGRIEGVAHRILMNGSGTFNSSRVKGGGSYDHFDFAAPVPRTLLSAGRWKAKRLVSFDLVGIYGVLAAGILTIDVDLLQVIPSQEVIPATLEIVCNHRGFGLDTGEEEGFVLTIPDTPFGPFRQLVPNVGITTFTAAQEERD